MRNDPSAVALRYVALNPVRAGLVDRAENWPWSSTRAHIAGESTAYVAVEPALSRTGDFKAFLNGGSESEACWGAVLNAELIGRPVGDQAWIEDLERKHGKVFSPQRRGRKPKAARDQASAEAALFGN